MTEELTLCVGFANRDEIKYVPDMPEPDKSVLADEVHVRAGGSATNTALGMASFGRSVALASEVGDDRFGDHLAETLADHGVKPILERDGSTTVIEAFVTPGDDPQYVARDPSVPGVEADDLDADLWEAVGHVHVTNYDPERAGAIAQRAASEGKTVSFNPTQGYEDEPCPAIVDAADVITLNDREADLLDDRHGLDAVAEDTTVVVTHGADGSTLYAPDRDEPVERDAFDAGGVRDTIGAGDSLAAGFLDAWLDGESHETALARGNACGAYAVTRAGAPDGLDVGRVRELAGEVDLAIEEAASGATGLADSLRNRLDGDAWSAESLSAGSEERDPDDRDLTDA